MQPFFTKSFTDGVKQTPFVLGIACLVFGAIPVGLIALGFFARLLWIFIGIGWRLI